MGKGKKSKNDRKETRKDRRDNLKKDANQSKSSTGKIKSNGGISKIEMTAEGEEVLLRLITMLDSGELEINLASALPIVTDDGDDEDDGYSDGTNDQPSDGSIEEDSGDSDDEDDEEDEEDEEDHPKDMKKVNIAPLNAVKEAFVFTDEQRRRLVRKLIRDDRRVSIAMANRLSEERVSRNLVAKAMMINEKIKQRGDIISENIPINNNDGIPSQYLSPAPLASSSSVLRVNISCGSKSGGRLPNGISKLVLTDRTEPLDRLLDIARNKFAAPKKFSQLISLPDGAVLNADSLFLLPDGAQLLLVIGDMSKDVGRRVKILPAVLDSIIPLENNDALQKKTDGSQSVDPSSETNLTALGDNYWCPPEKTYFTEAQQTPRIIGDEQECRKMQDKQIKMFADSSYKTILSGRRGLPIYKVREVSLVDRPHLTDQSRISCRL